MSRQIAASRVVRRLHNYDGGASAHLSCVPPALLALTLADSDSAQEHPPDVALGAQHAAARSAAPAGPKRDGRGAPSHLLPLPPSLSLSFFLLCTLLVPTSPCAVLTSSHTGSLPRFRPRRGGRPRRRASAQARLRRRWHRARARSPAQARVRRRPIQADVGPRGHRKRSVEGLGSVPSRRPRRSFGPPSFCRSRQR
jgi:hypothetical protein